MGVAEGDKEDEHQAEAGVQIPAVEEVALVKQQQPCNKRWAEQNPCLTGPVE